MSTRQILITFFKNIEKQKILTKNTISYNRGDECYSKCCFFVIIISDLISKVVRVHHNESISYKKLVKFNVEMET